VGLGPRRGLFLQREARLPCQGGQWSGDRRPYSGKPCLGGQATQYRHKERPVPVHPPEIGQQEVLVHLGTHQRPEDALEAWPSEVEHLRAIGREELEAHLHKLRALIEAEKGKE
jgi:hypothetical protein